MIGSVTMLGYFIMALLYWWPHALARTIPRAEQALPPDPTKAVEQYRLGHLNHRHTASRISF
jgi:hypothetical protein